MKFLLLEHWPQSQSLIEAGTIIDGNDPAYKDKPLPLCAKASDQEALDALCRWHSEEGYRWLHYAKGLRLPTN